MNGKIVGSFIVASALIVGAVIYYLQVYAFYREVPVTEAEAAIRMVPRGGGVPRQIEVGDFEGIDADSSPLRFRACFTVPVPLETLTGTYEIAEAPEPLTGPGWFDCYDAEIIGEALERGEATAFLSEPEVHPGVRRLVAVFPDGRAYAWHQLIPEPTPTL